MEVEMTDTQAEWMTKVKTVKEAVKDDAAGHIGVSGQITCPVCTTGNLDYSISKPDSLITAECTTDGCFKYGE